MTGRLAVCLVHGTALLQTRPGSVPKPLVLLEEPGLSVCLLIPASGCSRLGALQCGLLCDPCFQMPPSTGDVSEWHGGWYTPPRFLCQ